MRKQPDFQKLFSEHFGSVPRKVTYEVRHDSNCPHDLIFLSSLIHDARFKRADVKLRGKRLTINVNRDCWELGFSDKNLGNELHIADSRLSISSVVALEWTFDGLPVVDDSTELWISNIRYSTDAIETAAESTISSICVQYPDLEDRVLTYPGQLTLDGHGWSLKIMLQDDRIKLTDKELPYLHTDR